MDHAKQRQSGHDQQVDGRDPQPAIDQFREKTAPEHRGQDESVSERHDDERFGQRFARGLEEPLERRRRDDLGVFQFDGEQPRDVGKNAKATAGACRAGHARNDSATMSSATKIRMGARTARGISSTKKETKPRMPPSPIKRPVKRV
jgi:hypothetical protein